MKQLVIVDEQIMVAFSFQGFFKRCRKDKKLAVYDNIFCVGDDTFVCDYLMTGLNKCNQKFNIYKNINYVKSGNESDYRKNIIEQQEIPTISLDEFKNSFGKNNLVFFFVNTTALLEKEITLSLFNEVREFLKKSKNSKCIVTTLLPKIEYFPTEAISLSERELTFFLEKECERTPEIDYYLEVEKNCREAVRDENLDITMMRLDNVFAPDRFHTPSFDLENLIKECAENNEITITDEDAVCVSSITYVRNACYSAFQLAVKGLKGHIYNVASSVVSKADIKQTIYDCYSDDFSLSKKLSAKLTKKYNCLNQLVFSKLKIKSTASFKNALKHAVSYVTGLEYDTSDNVAFYAGKIKTIQALEIEILKEIDRICVENDIKYFLAGGSLLGAVRSGGSIPWDDDLDIGMLREDYEKFRKICEEKLQDKFEFSSPFNGSGSHYTIEKVRLKSTYFSTNYSSKNNFPDGVFVDVLVYDQTSNSKIVQFFQTLILAIIYDCIIVRWYNVARKKYHYRLTKILLPILRLFPWGFYHGLFEFFVKLFKNKKDAEWLIDSVGKKLKDGPLPKKGLEDTVYVDFDGIKAPIPVDYTGYLNYAYGPNYMEKPNLSNRRCPHNFARIDLGKYVFDVKGEKTFREVDLRGELFESEEEK